MSAVTKLDEFRFVRDEVKHEYTVLGSRLTSYLTSQSFLVSAYAVSMNNTGQKWSTDWRLAFPVIVAITGLVLSLRAVPGITSAVKIINVLHEKQRLLHADPDVRQLDFMEPDFMIAVHKRSLQFSTLSAYVFGVTWIGLFALTLYIRSRS